MYSFFPGEGPPNFFFSISSSPPPEPSPRLLMVVPLALVLKSPFWRSCFSGFSGWIIVQINVNLYKNTRLSLIATFITIYLEKFEFDNQMGLTWVWKKKEIEARPGFMSSGIYGSLVIRKMRAWNIVQTQVSSSRLSKLKVFLRWIYLDVKSTFPSEPNGWNVVGLHK